MTTSAVGRPNPFWEFLPWPGFDFELDLNLEFLAFKDRRRLNGKWHGVRVGQVGQRINISLCSGIASGPQKRASRECECVPVYPCRSALISPLPRSVWPPPLHPPLHQHKQTGTRIWSRGQMERMVRYEQRSNGQVKVIVMSCKCQPPTFTPLFVSRPGQIFQFHLHLPYSTSIPFCFSFLGTVGNKIDFHNIFYASR